MSSAETTSTPTVRRVLLVVAWLWVIVPFLYGLVALLSKIPALFGA